MHKSKQIWKRNVLQKRKRNVLQKRELLRLSRKDVVRGRMLVWKGVVKERKLLSKDVGKGKLERRKLLRKKDSGRRPDNSSFASWIFN